MAATQAQPMASGDQRRPFNAGDLLHLLQIVILLASLGVIYQKFQQTADLVGTHSDQLNRIEHYLSSKDPHYWDRVEKDHR